MQGTYTIRLHLIHEEAVNNFLTLVSPSRFAVRREIKIPSGNRGSYRTFSDKGVLRLLISCRNFHTCSGCKTQFIRPNAHSKIGWSGSFNFMCIVSFLFAASVQPFFSILTMNIQAMFFTTTLI